MQTHSKSFYVDTTLSGRTKNKLENAGVFFDDLDGGGISHRIKHNDRNIRIPRILVTYIPAEKKNYKSSENKDRKLRFKYSSSREIQIDLQRKSQERIIDGKS